MFSKWDFTWSTFSCLWIQAICLSDTHIITHCLHSTTNRVSIKCPRRHVIYNPSVVTGVGVAGECTRSVGDCIGIPDGLRNQIDRCHWQRRCDVVASNNDVISCGETPRNTTQRITYMAIKQPYCIPKGIIFDLCSPRDLARQQRHGVIRSHRKYPVPVNFKRRPCTKRLLIEKSDELFFQFIGSGHNDNDMLSTTAMWTWEDDNTYKLPLDAAVGVPGAMNVSGQFVDAVDIFGHFDWMAADRKHGGYIIPFAFYDNKTIKVHDHVVITTTTVAESVEILKVLFDIFLNMKRILMKYGTANASS